jgi:hypothetical protein
VYNLERKNQYLDASQPWLCYWIVNSLDILSAFPSENWEDDNTEQLPPQLVEDDEGEGLLVAEEITNQFIEIPSKLPSTILPQLSEFLSNCFTKFEFQSM